MRALSKSITATQSSPKVKVSAGYEMSSMSNSDLAHLGIGCPSMSMRRLIAY